MYRLRICLVLSLLVTLQTYAQTSTPIELFKNNTLPQHSTYFNNAQLTANGMLELTATAAYMQLNASQKKSIMYNIVSAWRTTLIIVQCIDKKELWNWNDKLSAASMLDQWSTNVKKLSIPDKKYNRNYFSLGYQNSINTGTTNTNKYFYTRLGSFLILNRLDLSTSYSMLLIPISKDTNSLSHNWGLMGRVHFPIKKINLNPNIGAEYLIGNDNYRQFAVNLGISWFIGFGSLDLGFRIGDDFTTMLGYTISPKLSKKK